MSVDGLEYNLATPDLGVVIIGDEGDEGTSVREGGSVSVPEVDWYSVMLSTLPSANVYVTVSIARSPQEEADDAFSNPEPLINGNVADSLSDGEGDTMWVCVGSAPTGDTPSTDCDEESEFMRVVVINGVMYDLENRAVTLTFTPGNWMDKQWVYVYAVDDERSEGDVIVAISHSVDL